ncbi:MAG: hypothetical protein V4454_17130 [Pseudomonadota bacterium]
MNPYKGPALPVKLPQGTLINCWILTRAIAKSICPSLREAKGIDCIKGKLQKQLGSDLTVCMGLNDHDLETLTRLLPELPSLEGEISDLAEKTFLYDYFGHPDNPGWQPVFFNANDLTLNGWEITRLQGQHKAMLESYIASGIIAAVNSDRKPTQWAGADSHVSRKGALQYLSRHLLVSADGTDVPEPIGADVKTVGDTEKHTSSNKNDIDDTLSNFPPTAAQPKKMVWTFELMKTLYEIRHAEGLEAMREAFAPLSDSFLRRKLREYKRLVAAKNLVKKTGQNNIFGQLGGKKVLPGQKIGTAGSAKTSKPRKK